MKDHSLFIGEFADEGWESVVKGRGGNVERVLDVAADVVYNVLI